MKWTDLALIAVIALAARLAFLVLVPLGKGSGDPNCAPDEAAHFAVVEDLSSGRLRAWPEAGASIYSVFPPVPYFAHATALAISRLSTTPTTPGPGCPRFCGYPYARLGSALLGVVAVLAIAAAAASWTGTRSAGLVAGILAALQPQHAFIGGYNNADSFTIAVGALLILTVVNWARSGESNNGLLAVGAAVGGVLVGKASGFFVLPALAGWIGWACLTGRIGVRTASAAVGLALAICAPFFAWNAARLDGDVLGLNHYGQFARTVLPGIVGHGLRDLRVFARTLWASSIGGFGNMSLWLPKSFQIVVGLMVLGGLAVAVREIRGASPVARRGALVLAIGVLVNLGLVLWNSWTIDYQPQGRYVLLSVMILTAASAVVPVQAAGVRFRTAWFLSYITVFAAALLWSLMLVAKNGC